jgi:diadenosine tetraphosphate (Ap4A) HIT family hydrolase
MTDSVSCKVCAFVQSTPPGGWYLDEPLWRVGPHMATQVPGWTVAYLRRHAAGLSEMTADELRTLGPTLAETARAIEASTDAERVYSMLFGENVPHVHFVLAPRGKNVPPEHRSSALHANARLYADPGAASAVGGRIREALSGSRATSA